MDPRGWTERFDELEAKAGPELMPLIISLRADMELSSFTATNALAELRIIRSQLSEQEEALGTLMLEVEHLRELLPV